jgi:hypothetical protein
VSDRPGGGVDKDVGGGVGRDVGEMEVVENGSSMVS